MNKKILTFLIITDTLLVLILVARFVQIEAPWPPSEEKPSACAPADSPVCRNQESINKKYLEKIRPIFQAKCLMCHGKADKVPLYSVIPPTSFLLKHDTTEAKEHMNMTWDYPFTGHHAKTPDKLFRAIEEVIAENDMPPLRYRIMHWQSGLTADERKRILEWVAESRKLLPKANPSEETGDPRHDHDHHHSH